ncbi:hypothetical protein [Pedobacter sp.]
MKHILLTSASSLEQRALINPPEQFSYCDLEGYWKNGNGELLVEGKEFAGVGSKKFDVETGEDKKYK